MKIAEPIDDTGSPWHALFSIGFRPFFLAAAIFSMVSMSLWMLIYSYGLPIANTQISAMQWHAHEMLYGYAMAVIAGFLLTAVRNWTGQTTVRGFPLMLLFLLWLIPRGLILLEGVPLQITALFDIGFVFALIFCLAKPIVMTKQWKQLGLLSNIVLLGIGNSLFYLGALGLLEQGIHWGLYSGLYLVIALVLTMSRRLVPFFIERGVGYQLQLSNFKVLDIASLILFLLFFVFDTFLANRSVAAVFAAILFVLHTVRLIGWYTHGIWHKLLLWSLYGAYAFSVSGFAFYVLAAMGLLSPFLAIHAFAVGGIGLITFSMMARVSLGHTGRNVHEPPKLLVIPLLLLVTAGLLRVFLPAVIPAYYPTWVLLSQWCWILAFAMFVYLYLPVLVSERADKKVD